MRHLNPSSASNSSSVEESRKVELRPWEWLESTTDTPISLSWFRAERLDRSEMTYRRQFKRGVQCAEFSDESKRPRVFSDVVESYNPKSV